MQKLLGLVCATLILIECPVNAQTRNYSSPLDKYLKKALKLVHGGDYDGAIAQYQFVIDEANGGCDQGHAIAGQKAAKAKLLSMPGHPHRGQAADTEFWDVLNRESVKLPSECLI